LLFQPIYQILLPNWKQEKKDKLQRISVIIIDIIIDMDDVVFFSFLCRRKDTKESPSKKEKDNVRKKDITQTQTNYTNKLRKKKRNNIKESKRTSLRFFLYKANKTVIVMRVFPNPISSAKIAPRGMEL
jgi:hypothetical protein